MGRPASTRRQPRAVVAALPRLPFADMQFDLSVCSHFLFLHSAMLDLDFHIKSVQEMLRVSREVRIFPLVTLECQPSPHLQPLCSYFRQRGFVTDSVKVDYQLQRNGDRM